MKFKQFLNEKNEQKSYKTEIEEDQILEIFKTNCKNSDFDNPLWRGMRGKSAGYIFQGDVGSRRSINSSNHYTVLIDHFIDKEYGSKYPLRSASIVAASNNLKSMAGNFGPDIYAVFPYDDSIAGVLSKKDMWDIKFEYNGVRLSPIRLNTMLADAGITDSSFAAIESDLREYIKKEDSKEDRLYKVIGGDVQKFLFDVYYRLIGYEFMSSSKIANLSGDHEVWIGSKCLAIKESVYNKLKKGN